MNLERKLGEVVQRVGDLRIAYELTMTMCQELHQLYVTSTKVPHEPGTQPYSCGYCERIRSIEDSLEEGD